MTALKAGHMTAPFLLDEMSEESACLAGRSTYVALQRRPWRASQGHRRRALKSRAQAGERAPGRDAHRGGAPSKRKVYAGRLRLQAVPDRSAATLVSFVRGNIAMGATIMTDGAPSYRELADLGFDHQPLVLAGDPEKRKRICR